uniref:Uncharacterized protein n=1 Tax=Anguilla anguilla TaxID=7936 RepID=A0A0E9V415_ANGAN
MASTEQPDFNVN